jgi:hypothetical protein
MPHPTTLPITNPTEATRYIAGKIGQDALYRKKGHQEVDFTRASARSERELINHLSLAKLGNVTLTQFANDDDALHLEV